MAAVGTCVRLGGIMDGELSLSATQLRGMDLVAVLVQHKIPIVTLAAAADGGGASWWDHSRWLQEDGDCGATCTGREILTDRESPVPGDPAVSLEPAPGTISTRS